MPGFEFNYTLYVLEAVFYICSVSDVAAHVRNSAGSMKLQITCSLGQQFGQVANAVRHLRHLPAYSRLRLTQVLRRDYLCSRCSCFLPRNTLKRSKPSSCQWAFHADGHDSGMFSSFSMVWVNKILAPCSICSIVLKHHYVTDVCVYINIYILTVYTYIHI